MRPDHTRRPFIANTDKAWFDFLAARADAGRVDEVNFWSPKAVTPMRRMEIGEPFFFRLKQPHHAIAGYGFFVHFCALSLRDAWNFFGWKNGDAYEASFLQRLGAYRRIDLLAPDTPHDPVGCTILREAHFWPRERWIPWGAHQGWAQNIVQGKTESDAARVELLLSEISRDQHYAELTYEIADRFRPLEIDDREVREASRVVREGQGAFRARLLDAYGRRCAITGERTEPVLEAAHIQRYLGPPSNHVQNGLLLTMEFHKLFDEGYVTVTPDLAVRVSRRLREDWQNGKRYYEYDGRPLTALPSRPEWRPSPEALEWHREMRFKD